VGSSNFCGAKMAPVPFLGSDVVLNQLLLKAHKHADCNRRFRGRPNKSRLHANTGRPAGWYNLKDLVSEASQNRVPQEGTWNLTVATKVPARQGPRDRAPNFPVVGPTPSRARTNQNTDETISCGTGSWGLGARADHPGSFVEYYWGPRMTAMARPTRTCGAITRLCRAKVLGSPVDTSSAEPEVKSPHQRSLVHDHGPPPPGRVQRLMAPNVPIAAGVYR